MSEYKHSEAGVVTAEFMLLVPWLMVFLGVSLGLFQLGLKQLEVVALSQQISRLVARTEVLEIPTEYSKTEFDVELQQSEGLICATVSYPGASFISSLACSPDLGR
jgi:hypothetical protein